MNRSVMMRPGHTVFTRMPSRPSCVASVFMRPATPGRIELDSSKSGSGSLTDTDWMVRMLLAFFAFMPGSTARMRRTVERSETSKAPCHCSSDISSK